MSDVELSEPPVGGYSVTLPSFEGPLDLLLHLCQKHELDILDIPIGFVTEKYLEYLAVMQLLNLDVASEYLVMAATLAHIKSKMLLPAPPPGQEDDGASEDEEDPREALIRRLLEYQKYKQAAADLAARGVAGRDVFFRGMPINEAVHTGLPPLAQVPLFSLVEAFQGVLSRSKIKLSHDIVHERMTLTDRINELVDLLRVRRRLAFEELFTGLATRFDLVITFLALLEMTKLRMTRLFQSEPTAPIYVEFSAQVGGDEEAATEAPRSPPDEAAATTAADDGFDRQAAEASPVEVDTPSADSGAADARADDLPAGDADAAPPAARGGDAEAAAADTTTAEESPAPPQDSTRSEPAQAEAEALQWVALHGETERPSALHLDTEPPAADDLALSGETERPPALHHDTDPPAEDVALRSEDVALHGETERPPEAHHDTDPPEEEHLAPTELDAPGVETQEADAHGGASEGEATADTADAPVDVDTTRADGELPAATPGEPEPTAAPEGPEDDT